MEWPGPGANGTVGGLHRVFGPFGGTRVGHSFAV